MLVKKFIQDVIEEKNGFSFDRPHRLGESALSVVVPVIRKTNMSRDYITLAEAKDVKIEDTGLIDQVYVKNYEDKPLYISRGEIFRGKTQERASIHGYIVMPNKGIRVAVRCIHASKCINAGMEMQYGGKVPYDIRLDNQAGTWNSVSIYTSTVNGTLFERDKMTGYSSTIASHQMSTTTTGTNILSVNTDDTVYYTDANCTIYDNYMDVPCTIEPDSTDDLVRTIDNMSDSIRDAMKKIPSAENQVGIVFITENKIKGLDIYDIPVSWNKIKDDVIEKEGSAFIDDSDDIFTFNPDKAGALIKRILSSNFTEKQIYDNEYRIIEIKYDDLIGEVVIFNQKVIHLTMWNKTK